MENQKLWDKYSTGEHWKGHPQEYALRFVDFLKHNGITRGKIADLGCGHGRDLKVFGDHGFETHGIDMDPKAIEGAMSLVTCSTFTIGDIENLGFANDVFDAAFMINVIHYVNEERAVREAFRVLKPGGYLCIHYNLEIIDLEGNVDYKNSEKDILDSVGEFVVSKEYLDREDYEPTPHRHRMLELILQKPYAK